MHWPTECYIYGQREACSNPIIIWCLTPCNNNYLNGPFVSAAIGQHPPVIWPIIFSRSSSCPLSSWSLPWCTDKGICNFHQNYYLWNTCPCSREQQKHQSQSAQKLMFCRFLRVIWTLRRARLAPPNTLLMRLHHHCTRDVKQALPNIITIPYKLDMLLLLLWGANYTLSGRLNAAYLYFVHFSLTTNPN